MEIARTHCDTLRAGLPSYLTYLAVPTILMCIGFAASQKVALGAVEYIVFFAIPLSAAVLAAIKLRLCKVMFCSNRIFLERFLLTRLRHERLTIDMPDVVFASVSNNEHDKLTIEQRSGLAVVPLSVFYVEYSTRGKVEKIAFDISSLDNRRLLILLRKYPTIVADGYHCMPGAA